jgi:hypothetical protein
MAVKELLSFYHCRSTEAHPLESFHNNQVQVSKVRGTKVNTEYLV